LKRGDTFLMNDPYHGGGSHLPDIAAINPVFVDDELVAFVANIAHHSDIGGRVSGSVSADNTSIFQEGLRLPPVRLVDGGELQEDILRIILLNTRTPRHRDGDIKAQLATNATGTRRIEALFSRFGRANSLAGMTATLNYSEARIRAGLDQLPDGTYEHEDFLDSDGLEDRVIPLKVAITIAGDGISFDFNGCAPQLAGARNLVLSATRACVYYAVKAIVDPDLPPNAGYFRAIEVRAPEGSVVNPLEPAATGDRSVTGNIIGDLLFGAFAKAVPDRVMAGCGPLHGMAFSGIDPRTKEYFVDFETFAGATGGLADQDGKDAVRVHISGAANMPVEAEEHEYPLTIARYELIPDSGGAGKFRGGLGTRRDTRLWGEDPRVLGRGLREMSGAPGLFGGRPGAVGRYVLDPGGPQEKKLPGTFSDLPVDTGATIRVETPGGAGFGDPLERDTALIVADIRAGKVTADGIEDLYGVRLAADGTVDAARTRRPRKRTATKRS
jgi:N-methylhydantoinase B